MLSTHATAKLIVKKKKKTRGSDVKIPQIVHAYNHNMGVVDMSDQILYCYLSEG